ncbi:RecBCD enzyme subunit RecB [mine drainage metagenome]|uniref:RecBCD enzyme subunit RecB n=1 Tax=mine drainage metagenome TaxID=410659 RepID=A0A1J5PQD9_9ZZZZ
MQRYQPAPGNTLRCGALTPQRLLWRHWWSASFSALTRELAHDLPAMPAASEHDERLQDAQVDSASIEPAAAPDTLLALAVPFNDFAAGARYGTLLHDLLEWQARNGWPAGVCGAADAAPTALQGDWQALLARQCQNLDVPADQQAMLDGWVRQIVTTNLPVMQVDKAKSTIELAAIESLDSWPEMGFSLPVQQLHSGQLDALIASHLWPQLARVALQPRQLQGMVTGFMDLVLRHQGRYYVLDYKSNKLPGYAGAQLQQAMLAHRYDVQAALYLLALHRLLKSRLPGYDYDLHVGGALYLFLRGIDQPGCGLLQLQMPRTLIESLDAAFSRGATLGGDHDLAA